MNEVIAYLAMFIGGLFVGMSSKPREYLIMSGAGVVLIIAGVILL